MYIISQKIFFVEKKQLKKGGDNKSLNLLIDSLGAYQKRIKFAQNKIRKKYKIKNKFRLT